MAVEANVGDILQNAVDQPVAQGGEAAGIFRQLRNGQFDGGSQAHDAGQVFRARAQAALLRAAEDQVGDLHALADVERADALGRVELVAGKAEHVHVPVVHVDGHGAHGLHRVGVEQHTRFMGNFADLADGLDGADFVVGGHDGDEDRIRADGIFHVLHAHQTVFIHR